MNRSVHVLILAVLVLVCAVGAAAQITITKTDIENNFVNVVRTQYGHDYTFGSWPTIGLYNAASGAQNLDFSSVPAGDSRDTSSLDYLPASGLQGHESFPTATFGARAEFSFGGGSLITFIQYFSIEDDGLYQLGNYARQYVPGFIDTSTVSYYMPKRLALPLPLTYGTTRSFTDTAINDATTGEYEVTTRTFTCNGFGTVTFPTNLAAGVMDAASEQGLRMQIDDVIRVFDSGNNQTAYGHNREINIAGASTAFIGFDVADTDYVSGATQVSSRGMNVKSGVTGVRPLPTGVPEHFGLAQNYPNPFNPSTMIRFDLPGEGFVTLKVYDVLGREVATLASGAMGAGSYTATFDAAGLAGGLYFARLSAGGATATMKMNLVK